MVRVIQCGAVALTAVAIVTVVTQADSTLQGSVIVALITFEHLIIHQEF